MGSGTSSGMSGRDAILKLGTEISPDSLEGVRAIYGAEQEALLAGHPAAMRDVAYGEHERHRLDVYLPEKRAADCCIIVWVHGGGFLRGDKGDAVRWENAHAGVWAAGAGHVGVVMNYRLAPEFKWPSGADDVDAVVRWARSNAAALGSDAGRIVLVGTSAGAAHVAGYIDRHGTPGSVAAAVLLSGLYGYAPMTDVRDTSYFGDDVDAHNRMVPRTALEATAIPIMALVSECDPHRFQTEFIGLCNGRLQTKGRLPRSYIASGHNHFSLAYHLGTADRRVSDEIVSFIADALGGEDGGNA